MKELPEIFRAIKAGRSQEWGCNPYMHAQEGK